MKELRSRVGPCQMQTTCGGEVGTVYATRMAEYGEGPKLGPELWGCFRCAQKTASASLERLLWASVKNRTDFNEKLAEESVSRHNTARQKQDRTRMKIYFTINGALQYSLLLNEQGIETRLISFIHFMNRPPDELAYYAEHGHLRPSDRSKFKDGLDSLLEPQHHDPKQQTRRAAKAGDVGTPRAVHSILRPSADAHQIRRRVIDRL
jgi:hypothetical protein